MKIYIKGLIFKHIVIVARNGEIILSSEKYSSKSKAIERAKKLAAATGWQYVGERR